MKVIIGAWTNSRRTVVLLGLALAVALLSAPDAAATKRILLVGDSWTAFPWSNNAYQSVLNYNFGNKTYEVEGAYTAIGGTTSRFWAENTVVDTSVYNIPTPTGPGPSNGQWGALDRISYALLTNPAIDIVHLSTGGVDVLTQWNASWSTAQEQALWAEIVDNARVIVNHIKSVRPNIKIAWCGYDYLNITETCTYQWALHTFPEFSLLAMGSAQVLGLNVNPFDVFANLNNNARLNSVFANQAIPAILYAIQTPNVEYINNFGVNQYRAGYRDSLGTLWGAAQVPYPGGAPNYDPLMGGNPGFGTPPVLMNQTSDGIDTIHLNAQGYKYIFDNCVAQYYRAWLSQP